MNHTHKQRRAFHSLLVAHSAVEHSALLATREVWMQGDKVYRSMTRPVAQYGRRGVAHIFENIGEELARVLNVVLGIVGHLPCIRYTIRHYGDIGHGDEGGDTGTQQGHTRPGEKFRRSPTRSLVGRSSSLPRA